MTHMLSARDSDVRDGDGIARSESSQAGRILTIQDVCDFIEHDEALSRVLAALDNRLSDGDSSHGLDHLLRVALWTVRLTHGQPSARLAIATALLHDAVNTRKDSPDRLRASARSAECAACLLAWLSFPPDDVALSRDAIRSHSRSSGLLPRTTFGRALQDADRLDALGVVALTRTLTTGGRIGQEILCWDDPWAERRTLRPDIYTVDHILGDLLPLPATLHNLAAREEGWRRAHRMLSFLTAWGDELGAPFPEWRGSQTMLVQTVGTTTFA